MCADFGPVFQGVNVLYLRSVRGQQYQVPLFKDHNSTLVT